MNTTPGDARPERMRTDYSIWAFAYTRSNMPRDFFGGTLLESNQGTVRNPMIYTALHGGPEGGKKRLALIDSMKMQTEVTAPLAGTVTAVHVAPGASFERGATLIELERSA